MKATESELTPVHPPSLSMHALFESRWSKALFKAPIVLFRLGLAPLVGQVMMLVTHTGRKSGSPRRTMIEYHRLHGVKYAPCALGQKAQWYRNIQADPRVTIQTAHGTESVRAVRVTDERELLAVYHLFKRRDPPLLNWYLRSLGIRPDAADVLSKKDRIYWIRFDPTDEPTPPPMDVDLAWVWPFALFGLATLALLRWRRASALCKGI